MYKQQTVDLFHKPKIKRLYQTHCVEGGASHITVNGETVKADDLSAVYSGKSQKQLNTDIGTEHEGMGHTEPSGDHEDSGDGDCQEQE
jgi:hypothetical protein